MTVLLSIVESPVHPNFSGLYRRLGITEIKVGSMRKAIKQIKVTPPDFVVAEFFYGYGNNYAGTNISNLDVFLSSLPKYAPNARLVVLADKTELQYAEKLSGMFPDHVHAVLTHPAEEPSVAALLAPE